MLTILCADGGTDTGVQPQAWHVPQVFEFISFPSIQLRVVEILVIVVARNTSNQPRYFKLAHRGAVRVKIVPACPVPEFPRVSPIGKRPVENRAHAVAPGISSLLLRRRFRKHEGKPQFRPRASVYDLASKSEAFCVWRPSWKPPDDWYAKPCRSAFGSPDKWLPFTAVQLGPFAPGETHLIGAYITISGQNYDRLVGGFDLFSVNGPELVMSCISQQDLSSASTDDTWLAEFQMLREGLCASEYYEIVLLKHPVSAPFRYCSSTPSVVRVADSIEECQVPADHFVSDSQSFGLTLRLQADVESGADVLDCMPCVPVC